MSIIGPDGAPVPAGSGPGPPGTGSRDAGGRDRWRARLGAAGAVLLFLGIAYGGWRLLQHSPTRAPEPCASPTVQLAPARIAVRVLNGTSRRGLARRTAAELSRRGFRITGVGNGDRLAGRSQVRYAPAQREAAQLVARQLTAPVLVADAGGSGTVDIVLGGQFRRLRTPAEVAAADRAAGPSATSRPSPDASPCR